MLAEEAEIRFRSHDLRGAVTVEAGDALGERLGLLKSGARFDRVLVNGVLPALPPALTSVLASGGRLVGAVTVDGSPRLIKVERSSEGHLRQEIQGPVRLAPIALDGEDSARRGRAATPVHAAKALPRNGRLT